MPARGSALQSPGPSHLCSLCIPPSPQFEGQWPFTLWLSPQMPLLLEASSDPQTGFYSPSGCSPHRFSVCCRNTPPTGCLQQQPLRSSQGPWVGRAGRSGLPKPRSRCRRGRRELSPARLGCWQKTAPRPVAPPPSSGQRTRPRPSHPATSQPPALLLRLCSGPTDTEHCMSVIAVMTTDALGESKVIASRSAVEISQSWGDHGQHGGYSQ